MCRILIWYVFLPVITLYLGILNNRSWMFALCAAEILLFVVQAALAMYQAEHLETRVQMPAGLVSERDPVNVFLTINNTGFLPVIRTQAVLGIRVCGEKKYKITHLAAAVGASDTEEFVITAGTLSPSLYELCFLGLEVYDYLGLFSRRIDIYTDMDIAVLPDAVCMPVFWEGAEVPIDGETDNSKKGQDYSEISDIREYRPGEQVRHIYWKLCAGSETLLVREGSAGRGVSAVVYIQIPQRRNSLPFIAKIAVSYMYSLLLQNKFFYAVFGEPPQRFLIRKREDLYVAVLSFYEIGQREEKEACKAIRKKKSDRNRYDGRWQEEISLSYHRLFAGEPCPPECWIYEGNRSKSKRAGQERCFILQEPGGICRHYPAHGYVKGSRQEWEQLERELKEEQDAK